jgi:DNA-binding response OmpR family regulator
MIDAVPGRRPRVLVVEDEEPIRDLVCFHLDLAGFECVTAADGREALKVATAQEFDLMVLDLLLPHVDGVTVCRAVRREGPNRDVPIMILTARREESDKVLGLDSGADDYLTKPFGIREFLARTSALMRRPRSTWRIAQSAAAAAAPAISLLGVAIDPSRRRVVCDGVVVSLTPQEFSLLYVLASNPGIVFSREDLLARVWHQEVFVTDRGVDTLVKRLRRKIETDPAQPRRVITVWGAGYKFGEL